jgi:hypothetical protein
MRRNPFRVSARRSPGLFPGVAAVIMACAYTAARGDEGRGFMQVRAAVMPRTDISVRAPQTLHVSAGDRARGTTLSADPLTIKAFSNTRYGLELDVQAPAGMFTSMHIQGQGIDATLPGAGGTIAWRWAAKPGFTTPASLDLSFTFELEDRTKTGTYSWPVLISGRALQN